MSGDERRRLIVTTALKSLTLNGAEGTSLRSVCRDMGVAPSLLLHFFKGWHEVLVAAYEALVQRLLAHLSELLSRNYIDERGRVLEMIQYQIPAAVDDESIGALLAFWQLSRSVPALREPFRAFLEERRRIVHLALQSLASDASATANLDRVTTSLIMMIDGFWLHRSLNPATVSAEEAQGICWAFVVTNLDDHLAKADISIAD
jgi:TetR/AcrR family transcriptional regulator, transcriptional repressor of bet genes